jgi:hypothetical protein
MRKGAHKMQRMASALVFLERYYKDGDEFLSHIVCVTGDKTKEQSKQWMHTHSPNQPKRFKRTPTRKLMGTVFYYKKEVLMVEFMQQETIITSEVYCETLKKTT